MHRVPKADTSKTLLSRVPSVSRELCEITTHPFVRKVLLVPFSGGAVVGPPHAAETPAAEPRPQRSFFAPTASVPIPTPVPSSIFTGQEPMSPGGGAPRNPGRDDEEVADSWSKGMIMLHEPDLPSAVEGMKILCYELMEAAAGQASPGTLSNMDVSVNELVIELTSKVHLVRDNTPKNVFPLFHFFSPSWCFASRNRMPRPCLLFYRLRAGAWYAVWKAGGVMTLLLHAVRHSVLFEPLCCKPKNNVSRFGKPQFNSF